MHFNMDYTLESESWLPSSDYLLLPIKICRIDDLRLRKAASAERLKIILNCFRQLLVLECKLGSYAPSETITCSMIC